MSEIYFVRHGQASFGKDNYDVLSERGIKQSNVLGEYLIKLQLSFDTLYSGEMKRQRDTASHIISVYKEKGLSLPDLQIFSEFNEYNFQAVMLSLLPEMIKDDPSLNEDISNMIEDKKSFQKIFQRAMFRWISGNYDKPDILKWDVFKQRVNSGITRVMDENGSKKKILIFSSGGTLSAIMQMALGLSDEETTRICWQICNASLTKFLYNSQRIILSSFNVTSYLELENQIDLITYR